VESSAVVFSAATSILHREPDRHQNFAARPVSPSRQRFGPL